MYVRASQLFLLLKLAATRLKPNFKKR